jgi:hypothetical protein
MTVEDGRDAPVAQACPHCGQRKGIQTFVKITYSGIRKARYVPGAVECRNDACPGPSSEFGNAWVRP